MTGHASATEFDPRVGAVAGLVTLAVLGTAFSLHALDVSWAWVVYPLGFGGVLPVALGAASRGRRETDGEDDPADDALAALRRRYARGEMDEATFERRVERVLERDR